MAERAGEGVWGPAPTQEIRADIRTCLLATSQVMEEFVIASLVVDPLTASPTM